MVLRFPFGVETKLRNQQIAVQENLSNSFKAGRTTEERLLGYMLKTICKYLKPQ